MYRAIFRHLILMSFFAVPTLFSNPSLHAQTRALITTRVDETNLTQLKGNVLPQLKTAKDLGEVDSSKPAGRLMLVLKRSDAQEAGLQSFLLQSHQQGSPGFHKWLAPGEFGRQFGAADADIAQLTGWMQSHGLKVVGASSGKNTIEFSGTAGQIKDAFHTSIHQYSVNGETHYANATNPQIPAAFTSAVAGITNLNDFNPTPSIRTMGKAKFDAKTHKGLPQWTYPQSGNSPYYFLTPEDFATQYDVKPVYSAGVDGTGQTIGVIDVSNVDLSLVNAYRKLFNLPVNTPQVIIDGNDPGIITESDLAGEAYLDVENAGAIAPAATIKLYVSASLTFAVLRAIDDDIAPVLSLSFNQCEESGTAVNAFVNSLFEQAAAQGQTILSSSGDRGSYGCYGIGVNGLASSPWDVAVGGTDAYFSDYATGGVSISTFWSSTNDADLGSLQKKMAEQPWDDSALGLNSIDYDPLSDQLTTILGAGGGGASACAIGADSFDPVTELPICVSGYPKPSWQAGTGVPNDGVRDLPDVSLFAGNADNGVLWPICAGTGDCTAVDPVTGNILLTGVGGTSASAPAMAGIMALVNQKYGPQGQANFTLYPLAKQFPAVFNDITVGSNNEFCVNAPYQFGCGSTSVDGFLVYIGYPATSGYDLASGLGSVDVNQLITNWANVTFKPSATTLTLNPTTIVHGTSVTANVTVSGTGIPAGAVSLVTSSTLPNNKGLNAIPLDSGGTGQETFQFLPGGTYTITGQYSGDGINQSSVSQPVAVTVTPEPSNLNLNFSSYDPGTNAIIPILAGATLHYGENLLLDASLAGQSNASILNGRPTGTISFVNGTTVLGTVSLNASGTAEYAGQTLPIGDYNIFAIYSGDASYGGSSAGPFAFTIAKENDAMQVALDGSPIDFPNYVAGQVVHIDTIVGVANDPYGGTPPNEYLLPTPTGSVVYQLYTANPSNNNPIAPYGDPITMSLISTYVPYIGLGVSGMTTAAFSNLPVGAYDFTVNYSGDQNFNTAASGGAITINPLGTIGNSSLVNGTLPAILSLSLAPATFTNDTLLTMVATITGSTQAAPVGFAFLVVGDQNVVAQGGEVSLVPGSGNTSTATFSFRPNELLPGNNLLSVYTTGDSNYYPAGSETVVVTYDQKDFSFQAQNSTIVIRSGDTQPALINLQPLQGFNGTVAISCTIDKGLTCNVPSTPVVLSGNATVTVNIGTQVTTAATAASLQRSAWPKMAAGVVLSCMVFFIFPRRRRFGRELFSLIAGVILLGAIGCSGIPAPSNPIQGPPTGPVTTNTVPGTYTAVISGTGSNGVLHNTTVTIIVQ